MTLLQVRNLSVTFETDYVKVNAVQDVSFDLQAREKVGFLGESGSGKTTTALALMGLIPKPGRVSAGTAMMSDFDYLALSDEEMAKRKSEWAGPRETIYAAGALWKYAQQVGATYKGAVTHPGGKAEKHEYMDL